MGAPGAGGRIATSYVATQSPDGYTFVMLTAGDGVVAATDPKLVPYGAMTSTFYTGLPAEWSDPPAQWIGPSSGDDENAPEGRCLFRRWTLIGEGPAALDYAGDNTVVAYINGRRVGEGGYRRKQRYEFEVTQAGWMLLAFELLTIGDGIRPLVTIDAM